MSSFYIVIACDVFVPAYSNSLPLGRAFKVIYNIAYQCIPVAEIVYRDPRIPVGKDDIVLYEVANGILPDKDTRSSAKTLAINGKTVDGDIS